MSVTPVIRPETGTHRCLINGVNDLVIIWIIGLDAEDNSVHRSQLETKWETISLNLIQFNLYSIYYNQYVL